MMMDNCMTVYADPDAGFAANPLVMAGTLPGAGARAVISGLWRR